MNRQGEKDRTNFRVNDPQPEKGWRDVSYFCARVSGEPAASRDEARHEVQRGEVGDRKEIRVQKNTGGGLLGEKITHRGRGGPKKSEKTCEQRKTNKKEKK